MTAFAMLPSNDYGFTLYPVTPDSRCPDDPSSYSDHWDPMLAASYHADLDRLSASIPSDMYPDHESIFDDDLIVFPRNNSHDNNNNPWCHSSSHPSCNPLATQQTLLVPSWTPGSAFSAPSTMSSTVDSPSMQWIAPHPVVGPPSMGQQHVMDHDMLATCAFDLDQPAVANGAFVGECRSTRISYQCLPSVGFHGSGNACDCAPLGVVFGLLVMSNALDLTPQFSRSCPAQNRWLTHPTS